MKGIKIHIKPFPWGVKSSREVTRRREGSRTEDCIVVSIVKKRRVPIKFLSKSQ